MVLKKLFALAVCATLFTPLCTMAANYNQKVSGQGTAIIEGDVETTQNTAMTNAKKSLILATLNRLLGTQVTESDEMFASQIPALLEQFDNYAQITSKSPSRDSARLVINVTALVDEVAFRSLLRDMGIGLNQTTREVGSIILFFDETEKSYDQPQDMFNEYVNYKRDNSKTYKENHSASVSEALNHTTVQSNPSDQNMTNDTSTTTQQEGANYTGSSKSDSRIENIHMDKEEYTYNKEYRDIREASISSGYVKSQLQKILKQYGLNFIDGSGKLAEFNTIANTQYHSYASVLESVDATQFKEFVRKATNANFMGIAYSQINYGLKPDETTGKYGCTTTQSNITLLSLKDSKTLDSGALESVQQSELSVEGCKSNARFDMATNLGQIVGLGIQKTIRDENRSFVSGPVVYKVIVQGSFDRPTRRAFESIMETMKIGFKSFKLSSQDANTIQYNVTYSGTKSIGDTLLDAAISPAFANLNSVFKIYDFKTEEPNTIILYPIR